jgi:hypothetical protein
MRAWRRSQESRRKKIKIPAAPEIPGSLIFSSHPSAGNNADTSRESAIDNKVASGRFGKREYVIELAE